MDYDLCSLILGFFISSILGAIVIALIIDLWLGKMLKQLLKPSIPVKARILTLAVGVVERFLYTGALISGYPEWIPVWLGFKVAVMWRGMGEDPYRIKFNLFLVGNGLSLVFGIIGAWIIMGHLPFAKPS